jgi:hypothetical protein
MLLLHRRDAYATFTQAGRLCYFYTGGTPMLHYLSEYFVTMRFSAPSWRGLKVLPLRA